MTNTMFGFLNNITLEPLPAGKNLYTDVFEVKDLDVIIPTNGKYTNTEKRLLTEFSTDLKERFEHVYEVLKMERETLKKSIEQNKIIYCCIDMMINNKMATDKSSIFILNRNGFGCYKITKDMFNEIFEDKDNEEYTLEEAIDISRNNLIYNTTEMMKVEADLIIVNRQLSILEISLTIFKNYTEKKANEKKL